MAKCLAIMNEQQRRRQLHNDGDGLTALQCVQFLYLSASFGFFGESDDSCSVFLPALIKLLHIHEKCSLVRATRSDLLDLGKKVNHSFNLIYDQAVQGAIGFDNREHILAFHSKLSDL